MLTGLVAGWKAAFSAANWQPLLSPTDQAALKTFALLLPLNGWIGYAGMSMGIYLWRCFRGNATPTLRGYYTMAVPMDNLLRRTAIVDFLFSRLRRLSLRGLFPQNDLLLASLMALAVIRVTCPDGVGHWHPLSLAGKIGIGLLFYLLRDFLNFLSHYLDHKIPLLWQFHKVHHAAEALNPLTGSRTHPVQDYAHFLLGSTTMCLALLLLSLNLGCSPVVIALYGTLWHMVMRLVALNPLEHSEITVVYAPAINWLINAPGMHHYHHSVLRQHWDCNFGDTLAIWDWMFGVLHVPAPGEALELGLPNREHEAYRNPIACFTLPFRNVAQMIGKSLGARRNDSPSSRLGLSGTRPWAGG